MSPTFQVNSSIFELKFLIFYQTLIKAPIRIKFKQKTIDWTWIYSSGELRQLINFEEDCMKPFFKFKIKQFQLP